jgi:dTDP-glucose pyrophosphorylase
MNNEELKQYIGIEELTVVEAMQRIDANSAGILFIVDEAKRLQGSVTDGDIRRWIIKTGKLDSKITQVMFGHPRFLLEEERGNAVLFMEEQQITSVPILDENQKVIDIIFAAKKENDKTEFQKTLRGTPVIIMAGGKGTRLYPYTKILPKPLIPIGGIPILERIFRRFCRYGVGDFYLTVNYKKEMIKSYFSELDLPYTIHYVEEDQPLGTAGSIKLIGERFDVPVIIANCDTLIEADYGEVLGFHKESGNDLTIVSSLKNITIPYGVLYSKEQGLVSSMEEKPMLSYFINTGMYIINPEHILRIPDRTIYHMTNLADQLMSGGFKVGMYPISENSFLDMGEFEEMKKMEERINSGVIT